MAAATTTTETRSEYEDLSRYEDILGQLPMLQVYSHIMMPFAIPAGVSRDAVIHDLEAAMRQIRAHVPWMAGKVVNVGKGPGHSGRYIVVPCPPPERLVEGRDVAHAFPPYHEIQRRKCPNAMLDSRLLAPTTAFPQRFDDSDADPARVIRLQASFVEGGVFLDFVTHHNMTDGGGILGFARLVAMAMRGEAFADSLLEQINRDRRHLIPLLGPDEPLLDHSHHLRPPITDARPVVRPDPARWHIQRFTAAKLAQLKALASHPTHRDPDVPFITTDDAASAFCWKKLTTGRHRRRNTPDTRSRFSRAIDGRKVLGIPGEYMGDLVHNVTTWLSFRELVELPLADIAQHMRRELNRANTAYHVRSFATFIAQEPDKSTIAYGGTFDPDTDVGSSSVMRVDMFPVFGKLGRPDFVRRPNFPGNPFPSLIYFFPQNPQGDCDSPMCLTEADLEALQADPEWAEMVEYIG
ncbi:trichothecene biosynthesis acetyltransferase [Aspergillus ellipticus CBS 707.79]|uniref:Trichothecene biosynthesis acetyltransferase n=1 Tax=Aspergillus ellipticus CBS 707.79 TaxID=1448320 RepID=A0A319DW48_9EURO|nr:trichothecene biosynthesis acetyltransferase [Aspergillus ellipticus CBS 707.79]